MTCTARMVAESALIKRKAAAWLGKLRGSGFLLTNQVLSACLVRDPSAFHGDVGAGDRGSRIG